MDFNVDEFLDQVAPDEPKESDGYLELYQYLAELLAVPYYGIFPVIPEFWENAQYSLRIYCFLG